MLVLTCSLSIVGVVLRLLPQRTRYKRWRLWFHKICIVGIISYLISLGLIWAYQPRLMYKPTHTLQTTPESHKLTYEEIWIPASTADEPPISLHSWWIPQPKNHIGTINYIHGEGLNIGKNVSQSNWLQWKGQDVLLVEYRGYGLSEGSFPTEASFYADAEAALNYLTKAREIPADEILLYGHSLGGAIAINLAFHHPELAGLIVHNSFTAMSEMIERSNIANWFPVQANLNQQFESLKKVQQLNMPKLYIHATGDPKIPVNMGKRLHAAAPKPKQLILIDLDNHENASGVYKSQAHLDKLKQFAITAVQ